MEQNVRFDSDRRAAEASLVMASSIQRSKSESLSGANGSMGGVLVSWQKQRFGRFELSIGERILRREDQVLPIGGRALDVLICLAECPGEVIAKQELLDRGWPDVTVEGGSLRVSVFAIRRAFGDVQFGSRYIASIKERGYAFVRPVVSPAGSAENRSGRRREGAGL